MSAIRARGSAVLRFGDFELRPADRRLLRGGKDVPMRAKTLAVLLHLTQRRGELATKDELMAVVWPETVVSESVLATSISELRRVLGDSPRDPAFIQTVHGVGYRFRAALVELAEDGERAAGASAPADGRSDETPPSGRADHRVADPVVHFCGRVQELEVLDEQLDAAVRGATRLVFVTGGPGEGKTSLVRTFAHKACAAAGVAIGQCLPEYDVGEPFLPILEALSRLWRGGDGERIRRVVEARSVQWATLLDGRAPAASVTRDRLLHELVEVLAAISAERPLVLVLEDLHWADPSTLALLRALGLRSDAMRLLVVATYRPVDAILAERDVGEIQRDVVLKSRGREIAVRPLSPADVREYYSRRYGDVDLATRLAETAWERTEGVPLFLVALADELETRGILVQEESGWRLAGALRDVEAAIPATIREMIDCRMRSVSELERRILEAGSVLGDDFAVDVVAGMLGQDAGLVDDRCLEVCRRTRLLEDGGEAAAAGAASRYRFAHVWYPTVVYQNLSATRRRRLHEAAARRLAEHGGAVDAEVAVHFERAGFGVESARWRLRAARRLLRRSPSEEAIAHLRRGLDAHGAARSRPEGADAGDGSDAEASHALRVDLQAHLAFSLMLLRGYTHEEVGQAYDTLRALVRDRGDSERHLAAISGTALARFARARLGEALELMSEGIAMARRLALPRRDYMGLVLFTAETRIYQAAFRSALEILDAAESQLDAQPATTAGSQSIFLVDPVPYALAMRAHALLMLGDTAASHEAGAQARAVAETTGHIYTIVSVLGFECVRHGIVGDWGHVEEVAPRVLALTDAHGFDHWGWVTGVAHARALAARSDSHREALDLLEASIAKRRAMGARFGRTVARSWAAGVHAECGDLETALRWSDSALAAAADSEEHWGDCCALLTHAELLRRRGAACDVVAGWVTRARETARRQEAAVYDSHAREALAGLGLG